MRRILFVFGMVFALTLMLTLPQAAKAATVSMSANCSLIQAIESANTNSGVGGCVPGAGGLDIDTIIVTTNVVLSAVDNGQNGLPVVTEDLTIRSSGPGVTRFITRDFTVGTPEFRILEIGTAAISPSVTIAGIHMNNGRVSGPAVVQGGCIYLRNGSLTVANSILQECIAQGADNADGAGINASGGAIYASSGTVDITNSSFSLNSVIGGDATTSGFPGGTAEGGAIHASGVTSFTAENTTFNSNFAVGGSGVSSGGAAKGGAIVLADLSGSMTASSFTANAASGGAASNGNSGISVGGAIVVRGGTLNLRDTDLIANEANGQDSPQGIGGYAYGGALYSPGSTTLNIEESDVSDNRAIGGAGSSSASDGIARGGGLYLMNTTATIDKGSVESNSISGSESRGGGIAVLHNSSAAAPLLVTRSTFAYNDAIATSKLASGGALYQEGDRVTVRNTTLSHNNADDGGALFQDNGTTVVALSTFSNNTADANGGAAAVDSDRFLSHAVDLINVTISGNTAGLKGGGLYITGSPLSPNLTTVGVYNTTVTNNANGGIYLAEDHTEPELESANTIIGGQASGADCGASGAVIFTSNGGNLETGTSCGFTAASDQQSVAALGLKVLGSYGGKTVNHDLLPDSPAVDAGWSRICNRQANKKDQRGFARFYDGNGDRAFDCDSGAAEYQGLLANPGFEKPLNADSDWTLVTSGGGDGRVRFATPNGKFAFLLQANAALESLSQTVPVAGGSGETYTLTLLASGSGLTVGEAMIVTLESTAGGTPVDAQTCTVTFPSATFAGPAPACVVTTTGAYDALNVVVGWDGATTGSLTLDAMSLNR
jgi:hypothetical protein